MALVAAVRPVVLTPRRFRLRHLLVIAVSALAIRWGVPRARAAWKIHDTATLFADYGLCMAGPTGATLLRDQPAEFWKTVRRRLVAAGADDKLFAKCTQLAEQLSGAARVGELHQARAGEFAEWGFAGASLQLVDLARDLPDLTSLSDGAWPFLRKGVVELIKPSLGAKEAIHPVGSARPGRLAGLNLHGSLFRARRVTDKGWFVVASDGQSARAVRSRDKGRNWTPTSAWQTALQGTHNRCLADGGERSFGLEPHRNGQGMSLNYYDQDTRTGQSSLGDANSRAVSLGCDESAAVVVTQSDKGQLGLWLCANDSTCRAMPVPPLLAGLKPDGIDAARLQGATVIAVTQGPLVRVVSTRDDGRVYMPFTVALDHLENLILPRETLRPAQLLAIGGTLILYQESQSATTSGVAVSSSDLGASWRTFADSASK